MSAVRLAHPGQPTRVIEDRDPYLGLSQRQRDILDAVRAYGGNRSRAARQLRISVGRVQQVLRDAAEAGVLIPAGATRRGPHNSTPRPVGARCPRPMPLAGTCGRREAHGGKCVSVVAWQRVRAA
jgi:hypothetical protein